MVKTVYSVKDCLTKGVIRLKGVVDENGIFRQKNPLLPTNLVLGCEAFYAKQEALEAAEVIKQNHIARLRQRIRFFEEIEFA